MNHEVAVIGGGVSGLITAYRLAHRGFTPVIFERERLPGGLGAAFEFEGTRIDRYFHFICPPDAAYVELVGALGLTSRLHWRETRMGVFSHGRHYRFGTPMSLLAFSPLPIIDRLRFGLAAIRARDQSDLAALDATCAREWLIAEQGKRCYERVWRPLLEMKFGDAADDVSAAWMKSRISRVARSRTGFLLRERLGYLEGGTSTLLNALLERVADAGGRLELETPVDEIVIENGQTQGVRVGGTTERFDTVVSTVAPQLFAQMTPGLPTAYRRRLADIGYHGVACWVLIARKPLVKEFWLNIDDPTIPLPGVITYTQLDPMPQLDGLHIHYVPLYMSPEDPRWSTGHDEGLPAVLSALDRIHPGFSTSVVQSHLFRDRWAQPLYTTGFGARCADLLNPHTPIAGLYRADMSQVYPNDRSIVNAASHALKVTRAVEDAHAVVSREGGSAR